MSLDKPISPNQPERLSFFVGICELHVQDASGFDPGRRKAMSALRMQGRLALPSAGHPGVDHSAPHAFAAISLPSMQRAAPWFLLPPQASQGFGNRRCQISKKSNNKISKNGMAAGYAITAVGLRARMGLVVDIEKLADGCMRIALRGR